MGGKSFKQSEKEELAFAVISSFMEDTYYESKDKRVSRIAKLVEQLAKDDPLFIAKLAIITRREFHMRSAFHVLIGELVKNHNGDSLVSNTIFEGVERPDDLLEIASYINGGKRPWPKQIQKGIHKAIHKFDGYQLAKYRGDNKAYSLVDLFNLVRPKPETQKEAEAWAKLIDGELKNKDTWESRLSSETGRADKGKTWKELIASEKMGYMAILRNLRNIAETADAETIKKVADIITNPELVKRSKQLPFRFLSAYVALGEKKKGDSSLTFEKDVDSIEVLQKAVEKALEVSIQNLPDLGGRTVILTDNSGSMRGDDGGKSLVSAYSKRTTADIANLFATLYWSRCDNTIVATFGDRLLQPKMDRSKSLFENFDIVEYAGTHVGPGTETGIFTMFEKINTEKLPVDRVIIFSDCQLGTGCTWYDTGARRSADFNKLFQTFRKNNPEAMVYSVDLRGYGNTVFSDGVVEISGWSDKIFDLMGRMEKKEGLVKWIEEYPVQLL